MTEVLIVVAVWAVLFVLVWATAVAVGWSRRGQPGPLDEHDLLYSADHDGLPKPGTVAARVGPLGAGDGRIVVADLGVLQMRLSAASVLLRAPRVAVVLVGADGDHEIAAVGHPLRPDAIQEITAPVGAKVLLVATRTTRDAAFDELEGRLLAATAATLGDVLAIPEEERRAATGRFARRLPAAARRPRP